MKQKLLTDIELDVHELKYLMDSFTKEPTPTLSELLKRSITRMQGRLDELQQEVDAVQVISPSAVEETAEEEDEVAGSEEDSPVIIQSLESVVVKEDEEGYRIYIKEDVPLNRSDRTACENIGIKEADDKKVTEALKKLKKNDPDVDSKLRDYMCENYYDIRTFGAVMTTFVKASLNCGQVRGPVQIGFARSIDPVISQEVTITRVAITTEKDAENKSTEMGRKSIVP